MAKKQKKQALIYTVGTRDVLPLPEGNLTYKKVLENSGVPVADRLYTKDKNDNKVFRAREGGKYILEHWQRCKKEIITPIFTPVANYLKNKGITNLQAVIFIATDQLPEVGERFYDADSLYFAQILKKLLEEKSFPVIAENIYIELVKEDVAYLDAMYPFWLKRFNTKQSPLYTLHKKNYHVFLCTQGGIDAINTALLLNCLNKIGKNLTTLSVSARTEDCSEQHFNLQYLRDREKIRLEELLKNYNYSAIKYLEIPNRIKYIAAYAEHRFNFDFEAARAELQKITEPELRKWRDNQVIYLRDVESNSAQNKIIELTYVSEILYEKEHFLDCTLRLTRIAEELGEEELKRIFGFDVSNENTFLKELEEYISKKDNKLRDFLENYYIKKLRLNYSRPNKLVYRALLEYFSQNCEKTQKALVVYQNLFPLNELRNKSIGAHDFDPISLKHIYSKLIEANNNDSIKWENRKEYKQTKAQVKKKIFQPLKEYFSLDANPYEEINKLIKKYY
ncbi:MAG: hypothetical protein NZ576_04420 [Bacteroidia bacterium]|nr:hypothetical protein [Bacteroidia bacterium]